VPLRRVLPLRRGIRSIIANLTSAKNLQTTEFVEWSPVIKASGAKGT
jgi:hypothetical protein